MAYEQLKLGNQICFRLYTVSRLVIQSYRPYLDKIGITYPQYLVLMTLWEQDNQLVSDISKKLVLESNTVTPLIQRMEKEGLVIRTKGLVDTRQRIISLTKKGKKLEEAAKDIPHCLTDRLLSCNVNLEEVKALAVPLDHLITSLAKE
ncbi:MAG: MarR family transcriptional regulator [Prevotella sp.]|nr:MarR family transcriptional regulator [Prevotella sp.]